MYTNNKLSKAVRLAIAFGAASSMAFSAHVAAADEEDKVDTTERIQVTGSRIRDANMVSSSPITSVSEEDFQLSGTTRVEDLLVTLPQLQPSFDAFSVNPSTGTASANLRGLGTGRTLVLVNGQRLQPGGIRSEAPDLNQIPAALVKRVEVLTGGASAVYGSDAIAGVVNFILDTDFEGVSLTAGTSAYQHNNRSDYVQGLMDERGFDYPTGNSGLDGRSNNLDFAIGSGFDGGRGHAMAYATWRKNDELRQGARDFSSCAFNNAATSCGGSSTSPNPSFFISGLNVLDSNGNPIVNYAENDDGELVGTPVTRSPAWMHKNANNEWTPGQAELYNYAPINHFQRPDARYTFGSSLRYEVNEHFTPYLETMFASNRTSVQIAESGTFFVNALSLDCENELVGDLCSSFNALPAINITNAQGEAEEVAGFYDPSSPLTAQVGKRNNEGGPRISSLESNSFRIVVGADGFINDDWDYSVSYLYGRNSSSESNVNDFLSSRTGDALLQCPAGSFAGCLPYNVWDFGGVTAEAADGLSGAGIRTGATEIRVFNAYTSGFIDNFVPTADSPMAIVLGAEYRKESFAVTVDTNMQTGNFTGQGGPRNPIDGGFSVSELFFEGNIPVYEGGDIVQDISLDLGYRLSDYSTSGKVNSYKLGFTAQVTDMVRVRGGYNRAIRGPGVNELFSTQSISLWGGQDRCAGETPSSTEAQCANTGVPASQYGLVADSPANQYNQFTGGNPALEPEQADTYTIGLAFTPIDNLNISLDYYLIELTDRIGSIGSQTILNFCATTGDSFLCDKVNRSNGGDLWLGSSLDTSGYIENLNANFGDLTRSGIDLNVNYQHEALGGRFNYSFNGGYNLKYEIAPLPGLNDDATYDCAGYINTSCNTHNWRHTARVNYSIDDYTVSLRWRYLGNMDYTNVDGTPGTADSLLSERGKLASWSYFDLSGSAYLTDNLSMTVGINNILDKRPPLVGNTLSGTGNSLGGYDRLGRYLFANATLRF